ncbi:MAG: tRNA pseudouridine(55) synthase TruB [Sumerlaeia bacterium]
MSRRRSRRLSRYHGVVAVDKPTGMTSQDVVNVVRRAAGTRRVGHTGTLDPLATGLLVVLLGEATRLNEYLVGLDKTYEGTMVLGFQSDTYDTDGEVVAGPGGPVPDLARLQELTQDFTGDIDQVPPPYSAKRVAGKKLYEYARKGEDVEVEARPVTVDEYTISDLGQDEEGRTTARFVIACSSGTYVRSLVHELGRDAGCGAMVSALRRTAVGDYTLEEAVALDVLRATEEDDFGQYMAPMIDALPDWPIAYVGEGAARWIKRGQAIPSDLVTLSADNAVQPEFGDLVFLCPPESDAIALAEVLPAPPSPPPHEFRGSPAPWYKPSKILVPLDEEEE